MTSLSRRAALAMVGAALSIALSMATISAGEGPTRLHIGDRDLKALMERGMVGSETFRSLVDQLDAAPIQVFAGCDSFMANGLSGRLNFVSSVAGIRYVQVTVRCSLPPRKQLALLAHELQHALEIATNPEIEDADSMESYYALIGFQTHITGVSRSFETRAAIAIQRQVEREMNDKASANDDARFGQQPSTQ